MSNKQKSKPKKYFDVKVACTIPAVLHYTVLAESPEEALLEAKKNKPKNIKYEFEKRKESQVTVYDYMTMLIRLAKTLAGRL